jgi:mono/diheme cytochrome c family protein
MRRLAAVFLGVAIVGGLSAVMAGAQAPDPKLVAAGRTIFRSSKVDCTQCHMAQGKGNKKLRMDGPTAKVAKLSAEQIRQWIVSPAEMTAKLDHEPDNPMKKKDLTEAEVNALVAYMLSLRGKK